MITEINGEMGDQTGRQLGGERAVFGISVASELTGVNPPMLRAYEARGLVRPERTAGGTRRYNSDNLATVDRITTLLAAGLNLAGVEMVLALEAETEALREEVAVLQQHTRRQGTDDPDSHPRVP